MAFATAKFRERASCIALLGVRGAATVEAATATCPRRQQAFDRHRHFPHFAGTYRLRCKLPCRCAAASEDPPILGTHVRLQANANGTADRRRRPDDRLRHARRVRARARWENCSELRDPPPPPGPHSLLGAAAAWRRSSLRPGVAALQLLGRALGGGRSGGIPGPGQERTPAGVSLNPSGGELSGWPPQGSGTSGYKPLRPYRSPLITGHRHHARPPRRPVSPAALPLRDPATPLTSVEPAWCFPTPRPIASATSRSPRPRPFQLRPPALRRSRVRTASPSPDLAGIGQGSQRLVPGAAKGPGDSFPHSQSRRVERDPCPIPAAPELRRHRAGPRNDEEPPLRAALEFVKRTGGDLLSQGVAPQVPSALKGLTALFGMGRGVSLSLCTTGDLRDARWSLKTAQTKCG